MKTPFKVSILIFSALLAAVCASCIDVIEPDAPDVVFEGDSTGYSTICNCPLEGMLNRAYRFTNLVVDQPARLDVTLDRMWEYEIANYLLNILFVIQEAEANEDELAAFSRLKLLAGPGWRIPKTPYAVDDSFRVTAYCLMDEELTMELDMTPYSGYQCRFRNDDPGSLYFHLGSLKDPLMCGPLLDPADSTPIMDMHISFGFNEDCTRISNGYLEGCLPQEKVNRICMCSRAGTCLKDGAKPGTPFPENDGKDTFAENALSGYCSDACGANGGWATFRGILDSTDTSPSCITADGEIGYRLSAYFDAEEVTDLFNPAMSGDCSGK